MIEELITTLAGGREALSAQGAATALFCKWGRVDRVMQKPRSVVIPEVVVGVGFADAKGGEGDDVRHDA